MGDRFEVGGPEKGASSRGQAGLWEQLDHLNGRWGCRDRSRAPSLSLACGQPCQGLVGLVRRGVLLPEKGAGREGDLVQVLGTCGYENLQEASRGLALPQVRVPGPGNLMGS